MVRELKEKCYGVEHINSFARVKLSERKNAMLENKYEKKLIYCNIDGSLNDFEWFNITNLGQFWIYADRQPVELLLDGKWIRFDERIRGKFDECLKTNENRFARLSLSNKKNVLLQLPDKKTLIGCWSNEEDLNNFSRFRNNNEGQFWIRGDIQPVELFLDGKWKRLNENIKGRFLR